MCESNVYLVDQQGEKTLVMESVDKVIPKEGDVYLENIFGERLTVKGHIKEMALVDHSILIAE
ncbi:CooT family nickel-binding protein [Alkalibacter rhizosphaerae]|uniref:CooT family nickel-binding protein n=1 Tax=Alkalibacter rhizosphaerae TaxID=2815577 RepID=A0A974XL26_9FIRM|nr:CooT family nickel-binding protein [Alkalibacter rhizosphaerae]QSX07936.1 CooT family nickel-binding protein [Alkalibacter rhizosphaerae]